VERAAQDDFVRRAGITAVQGNLYQPPVPAAEFAAWLHHDPSSDTLAM
jgi:EAL domain-containing protein (putative c-di-GMP-specific phosphodiesterase class I)